MPCYFHTRFTIWQSFRLIKWSRSTSNYAIIFSIASAKCIGIRACKIDVSLRLHRPCGRLVVNNNINSYACKSIGQLQLLSTMKYKFAPYFIISIFNALTFLQKTEVILCHFFPSSLVPVVLDRWHHNIGFLYEEIFFIFFYTTFI